MASGPGIYLATGLTVLLSLLVGAALCVHSQRGWSWLAPGCGFAAVLSIAWIAARLPGDGLTAGLLLLIVGVAAAVHVKGRIDRSRLWVGVPVAGLITAAASLPFLGNHRFGPLGATVNDDLALHLEFADILAQGSGAGDSVDIAYPVGPHSLVAALSDLFGMSIESAFLGVIIAIPILTALTALAALDHAPPRVQPIGAVLVGFGYLSAAFFVQASFKETVIASLVLSFTLVLRELVADRGRWRSWILPLAVLVFAGLGAFSVPALFWLVGITVAVALTTMVSERIRPTRRTAMAALGLCVLLVATVLVFEALTSFFRLGPGRFVLSASEGGRGAAGDLPGGNLFGPLSPFEALGVWPAADFRFDPASDGWKGGVALACLATLVGTGLTAYRREWVLLTATAFTVVTYALVGEVSLDYNAAKALVIATPLIALVTMAGLLTKVPRRAPAFALAALTACFVVAAAHSSIQPLKNGIVRPNTQAEAFAEMRRAVAGRSTIFLGRDNYAGWELRSTRIGYLGFGARALTLGYRSQPGAAKNRDVESLRNYEIERADFLVAPNTLYASLPGPEFRVVRRNRWYKLYRRTRPSPLRRVLEEAGEPGAVLRCSTAEGKAALAAGGRAFVRPEPVVGPVGAWTFAGGGQAPADSPVALAGNRQEIRQTIDLPPGQWEISLSWASSIPIDARIGKRRMRLPPYIGDGDRHWRVASVRGGRPLEVVLVPGPERRFDVPRGIQAGTVAAVREDVPGRFVPVARACGRYVDFVEL